MNHSIPGAVLANRFRFDETLEARGLNDLHRGHDLWSGKPVAIQTLAPHLRGASVAERVIADLLRAKALAHPNLVPVLHAGSLGGDGCFCVMPWLEMTNVGRVLLGGRLPAQDVAGVLLAAARGLGALHRIGIVHRALTPARVAIALAPERVLVTGFAFGGVLAPEGDAHDRATTTVVARGQLDYIAPESDLGAAADHRVDVYALAAIAYRAITGSPPFESETNLVRALVTRQRQAPPALGARLREPVDPALEAVMRRGLAPRPDERYQSVEAFADALWRVTHGDASPSPRLEARALSRVVSRTAATPRSAAFERPTSPRSKPVPRRERSSPSITIDTGPDTAERHPSAAPARAID